MKQADVNKIRLVPGKYRSTSMDELTALGVEPGDLVEGGSHRHRRRYAEQTRGMTRREKVAFYNRMRWQETVSDAQLREVSNARAREAMRRYYARLRAVGSDRANWCRNWVNHRRGNALKRGIEFTITGEDLPWPADDKCPVFGVPFRMEGYPDYGAGLTPTQKLALKDLMPTVDRIDNARGYVPGNVVIVSGLANRLKSNATATQLRALADFYAEIERRAELGV